MIRKKTGEEKYFEGVGRRKTAVARVRIFDRPTGFVVNEKKLADYFSLERHRQAAVAPLEKLGFDKIGVSAKVSGGGVTAQAEAVRHGLARALSKFDQNLKKRLGHFGFLTRDSRMVERKKYGLKKARRAPQWAKR